MATRSDIIVHRADGTWKRVYCHWDGYLSNNGKILINHYATQALADAVVEPGDISSLDIECIKPAGHSYDKKAPGCTVYYNRDRGEDGALGTVGQSLAAVYEIGSGNEYTYVFADVGEGPRWHLLDEDAPALIVITPEMCEEGQDDEDEDGNPLNPPAKIPLPESFGKLVPEKA